MTSTFVVFEVDGEGRFGHPTWVERCNSELEAIERYHGTFPKYFAKTLMIARLDAFTRHELVPTFSIESEAWNPWKDRDE